MYYSTTLLILLVILYDNKPAIQTLKFCRLRSAGHVVRKEKTTFVNLTCQLFGKEPVVKPRRLGVDNIEHTWDLGSEGA